MDIQNRVVNYYKTNSFIQNYLKGIDAKTNEVVLNYNGVEKRILIDSLENIKTEDELNAFFQGKSVVTPEVAPVAEPSVPNLEAVSISPVEEPIVTSEPTKESLNDIKILVELKNKDGLDNILKKFSVNPTTGLIDINTAISTVTKNTMNEVVNAIKSGVDFDSNLMNYDIEGKYNGTSTAPAVSEDEMIAKSFNNVKIYLDASKMYPDQVNYNDEQISNFMKTYISKVKEELHGAIQVPEEPQVEVPNMPVENKSIDTEIPASASAGFADIFVLTVIVLVYAVIIVNLILKLK